ncbi:hypothetical protein EDC01DRAFT_342357 [Geopyxis carbonaria]|nr:hypothetical protein EDC01DRAFT_342357 [Geopyxis carbonaria]
MKKPFTAVTVLIERLTAEEYPENDFGGIPDLIETIKLQDSGPAEASRAIRKKLKYGNVHRQLRALTILDALIGNAGRAFQRTFADEPLLERLRISATSASTDPDVRARLKELFIQWARAYKEVQGLQGIAGLYKQFPQRRKVQPKRLSTNSLSAAKIPTSPSSSTSNAVQAKKASSNDSSWKTHMKSSSKSKPQQSTFNLEKEKPALNQTLANASIASTNLMNALKLINREKERPSETPEILSRYEACQSLKTSILRYIQHIESEQWLGSLIHAHEELSTALDLYEQYEKPIDEDSDSDDEWESLPSNTGKFGPNISGLSSSVMTPPVPPRPEHSKGKSVDVYEQEEVDEFEDPEDPFGNQYRIVDTAGDESNQGARWLIINPLSKFPHARNKLTHSRKIV